MNSWRDGTSEQAQNDLDDLLSAALGLAQETIEEDGELGPFAVVVTVEDELEGRVVEEDDATTVEILDALVVSLTEEIADLRAVATVAEGERPDGGAGIMVEIEHMDRSAPPLLVVLPYTMTGSKVSYGELESAEGTRRFWA